MGLEGEAPGPGMPQHVPSPWVRTPAPLSECVPYPSPICRFPLLTSPPPALTLPGGQAGKGDRKPRRGKEARGVGCFPVLWGLSLSSLKIPNSWCSLK